MAFHIGIVAVKIVGVQEKKNAPTGLVSDGGFLLGRIRFGEQEGGFPSTRADKDPAFVILRGIFDQVKLQDLCEEIDGFVIIADEKSDVGKGLFHGKIE